MNSLINVEESSKFHLITLLTGCKQVIMSDMVEMKVLGVAILRGRERTATGNLVTSYARPHAWRDIPKSKVCTVQPMQADENNVLIPECQMCREFHPDSKGCVCAKCKCGLHGEFMRCVVVDDSPKVWCPKCYDEALVTMPSHAKVGA